MKEITNKEEYIVSRFDALGTNSEDMEYIKKALEMLGEEICWENWEDSEGSYFTVPQVLHSRLEELREVFCIDKDESYDEFNETINMVEHILLAIDKDYSK
jgi:hypothetical protein